jgi:hypothetical protein
MAFKGWTGMPWTGRMEWNGGVAACMCQSSSGMGDITPDICEVNNGYWC